MITVSYRSVDIFFLLAWYAISIPCVAYCIPRVARRIALAIMRKVERNPQLQFPFVLLFVFFAPVLAACSTIPARGERVDFQPKLYAEADYPSSGRGPEDYCSGDVLFEGDPTCEELHWCAANGVEIFAEEWKDCRKRRYRKADL